MARSSLSYFLIRPPNALPSTEFNEFMTKKMSFCLKNRHDNVILDLSQIQSLQRIHINGIAHWLRNLKSLGGTLTLIGISEKISHILSSTNITDTCELYQSLSDFQKAKPDAHFLNKNLDVPKSKEQIIPEIDSFFEITEENIHQKEQQIPHPDEKSIQNIVDSHRNIPEEPLKKSPLHIEGSITGSINLKEITQISQDNDVSNQLDFLNNESISKSNTAQPNKLSDKKKNHKTTVHFVNDLIEYTGEYHCVHCGNANYFLKGYLFSLCEHDSCQHKDKGWSPVLILY